MNVRHQEFASPCWSLGLEALEPRVLMTTIKYPLDFRVWDAPLAKPGLLAEKVPAVLRLHTTDWQRSGRGILKLDVNADVDFSLAKSTIYADTRGRLVVSYPTEVRPGQKGVPVSIRYVPQACSTGGITRFDFDVPISMDADCNVRDDLPKEVKGNVVAPGRKGEFDANWYEGTTGKGMGSTVHYTGWSGRLGQASVDLLRIAAKYLKGGWKLAAGLLDAFIDLNFGIAFELERTDDFTPRSIDGILRVGGKAVPFSTANQTTTLSVDIPANARNKITFDVDNVRLDNTFRCAVRLLASPYMETVVRLVDYTYSDRHSAEPLSWLLWASERRRLPFTAFNPDPVLIPVKTPKGRARIAAVESAPAEGLPFARGAVIASRAAADGAVDVLAVGPRRVFGDELVEPWA